MGTQVVDFVCTYNKMYEHVHGWTWYFLSTSISLCKDVIHCVGNRLTGAMRHAIDVVPCKLWMCYRWVCEWLIFSVKLIIETWVRMTCRLVVTRKPSTNPSSVSVFWSTKIVSIEHITHGDAVLPRRRRVDHVRTVTNHKPKIYHRKTDCFFGDFILILLTRLQLGYAGLSCGISFISFIHSFFRKPGPEWRYSFIHINEDHILRCVRCIPLSFIRVRHRCDLRRLLPN